MKDEIRNFDNSLKAENRHVEGYAIVVNKESRDLGGFTEIISPDALTEDIISGNEILCPLNHNIDRGILARSVYGNGSLKLSIDEKGLKYEFEAPNTPLGDELLEGIKRGDITTSSFRFKCADRTWEKKEDGRYVTTVNKFERVNDVSPVYMAAYNDTTVALRSLEDYKQAEEKEELEKEKNKLELKEYFDKIRGEIK